MGSYYDKLRAQMDDYDHSYNNAHDNYSYNNGYENSLWGKKQKDKHDNDCYDHSSDKRKKYDYPTINVKQIVNCCDHKKDEKKEKKENVRSSAFRAVNNAPQNIAANTRTKVLFQTEQFDLAGEYNPNNSTFIPSEDGVYNITATVTFNTQQVNRSAFVGIRVNGVIITAGDNDFFGPLTGFTNIVTATTILRLNAGDEVDVIAGSSIPATISVNDPTIRLNYTHFEAARFPSQA